MGNVFTNDPVIDQLDSATDYKTSSRSSPMEFVSIIQSNGNQQHKSNRSSISILPNT